MLIRSDDEAIGVAGTIQKHIKEKKKVIKVVFSGGEKSHPHLQEKHVKKERKKESKIAANILGIEEIITLGLKDLNLKKEIERPSVEKRVKDIIKKYNPERIYCTSSQDPHPDHRAVNQIVLKVIDTFRKKYPVFAYEVWNLKQEVNPAIYIDITKYMDKKLEYIKSFKSQWVYMFTLYFPAIARAKQYGMKNNCKYAEKFYKLR